MVMVFNVTFNKSSVSFIGGGNWSTRKTTPAMGGALEKIAPSGGRREHFWGISCEKSRFYAKKSYFFQF
jgi:hypothetical protein